MISPHFPPDSSAGTHRVRLLAPHLAGYGWEPTVLTVAEQDYEGRIDPELATLVPPSLAVVRSRALSHRWTRAVGIGDLGLRALPGLRRAAWRLFEQRAFDAVFITIYPTYPAVLGPMLKRRFGVPFVLDYQDPWVGAWGKDVGGGAAGAVDIKSRSTRALAARLEPRVLRAADGVTAVSARTYEDACSRTGATPRAVAEIPIGWDARTSMRWRPRRSPAAHSDDGRVNICYGDAVAARHRPAAGAAAARRSTDPGLPIASLLFFGTSNQSTGGEPRAPHARGSASSISCTSTGVSIDAPALRQASALLMGSSEPHYAEQVFPASGRIVRCWRCITSKPVLEMLPQRHQAARVIAFSDARPVNASPGALPRPGGARVVAGQPVQPIAPRSMVGARADGRLASVCDRVAVTARHRVTILQSTRLYGAWFLHRGRAGDIDLTVLYASPCRTSRASASTGVYVGFQRPTATIASWRPSRGASMPGLSRRGRRAIGDALTALPDVSSLPGWHSRFSCEPRGCRRRKIPVLSGDSNREGPGAQALVAAAHAPALRMFDGYLSVGTRAARATSTPGTAHFRFAARRRRARFAAPPTHAASHARRDLGAARRIFLLFAGEVHRRKTAVV
jgi:hypothetical protein